MITFFISLALLVLGYFTYGRLMERIFGPDSRAVPISSWHRRGCGWRRASPIPPESHLRWCVRLFFIRAAFVFPQGAKQTKHIK